MSRENGKVVREVFEARRQRDWSAFRRRYDSDIKRRAKSGDPATLEAVFPSETVRFGSPR
jgi:hypothetical protein